MKNLTIITLLFFLIGCKSHESGIENTTFSIAPNSAAIDVDKIFKQIRPIQLNNLDLPLSVYRVLTHSKGFYILDGQKQTILNIDSKGNIINVLKDVGDATGEYQETLDIKRNPYHNTLVIIDIKSAKML